MIELDFLGLDATGDMLTFSDADGNRYETLISDELRAALRKDVTTAPSDESPKPMTPREIQSYFRQGMSLEEVADLSAQPAAQLSKLAYPIFNERQYIAQQAQGYVLSQEFDGMTLRELVSSRLVERGVQPGEIEWDATRKPEQPWTLHARYIVSGERLAATWSINLKSRTVQALDDESSWLTETVIPAPTSPWRPLNTPAIERNAAASEPVTALAEAPTVPSAAEAEEGISAPDYEPNGSHAVDIDAVLASLDSQRGVSRPMPTEEEFFGAHPAQSEPENATDAQILAFPSRAVDADEQIAEAEPTDAEVSGNADATPAAEDHLDTPESQTIPGLEPRADEQNVEPKAKKSRRERPAMPSWDEIVFGYSKSDE